MKKGLLALMVVAMVAMAVPAGALAPTIETLPAVLIGSAGDTFDDGGTIMHLFRYNNILDISASNKITWNNADLGFGTGQMHAYYMMESAASPIMASTSQRFVDQVTAADLAAISVDGTRPAAAAEITDDAGNGGASDFFMLSLVNNPSAATDSYSATAEANGRPAADYDFTPEVMTLALVDGDFPTDAMSSATMTIYTVASEEDGFSPAAQVVADINFVDNQNNWVFQTAPGFQTPAHSAGAIGLTIQGSGSASGSAIYFGSWASSTNGTSAQPVIDVNKALQTGMLFRGTFTLGGTAATDAATPGYRIMYSAEGFTHLGGMAVFAGTGFVGPSQAGAMDAMVYWQPPFSLTQYGDTDILTTVQSGKDFRDYIINFDMADYVASDTGAIGLQNMLVELILEPEVTSSLITWGSGNTPFQGDLQVSGWLALDADPAGLGQGTGSVTANTVTLTAGNAALGYKAVGMFGTASGLPAWTSNQLVRVQSRLATSSTNATPTLRLLTLPVDSSGVGTAFTWFDVFDGDTAKTLYNPGTAAAAPVSGGSTVNSYLYTHTGVAGGKLSPNIDCYNASNGGVLVPSTGQTWPNNTATLTLSQYGFAVVAQ